MAGLEILSSEGLFRLSAMHFAVFSPDCDGGDCSAPKPGKKEQKSYDYCAGILMVHGFNPSILVFTCVLRRIGLEVTRKIVAGFKMAQRAVDPGANPGLLLPNERPPWNAFRVAPIYTGSILRTAGVVGIEA